MTKAYTLRKPRFEHAAGTQVYMACVHDWGLAGDDSRATGVAHVSVTLKADGSYPVFTVPYADLIPVVEKVDEARLTQESLQ